MKKHFCLTLALVVAALSSTALAETPARLCEARKGAVADIQKQQAEIQVEVKAIEDELAAIEEKKKELFAKREEKNREAVGIDAELRKAEADQKNACAIVERCKKAADQLAELKGKAALVKEELKAIRAENQDRAKKAADLKARIEKLEKQYADLNCRELVAGETAQSTIDKCDATFTEWNALQKELNELGKLNAAGRARFVKAKGRMLGILGKVTLLKGTIKASCMEGPEMKDAEALEAEGKEPDAIETEIKATETQVQEIKQRKPNIVKPKVKKGKAKGKLELRIEGKIEGKAGLKLEAEGKAKAEGKVKAESEAKEAQKAGAKAEAKGSAKAEGSVKVEAK